MMFTDDVVLYAREKYMLELELEQWKEALEKRVLKVSRAKAEYMWLNGMPLGSVKTQSAQLSQVTEFKYLGSTRQSDGDTSTYTHTRKQCGWNNRRKMPCIIYAIRDYHHMVESITERCRKARLGRFDHVKRRYQDYVGRKTL